MSIVRELFCIWSDWKSLNGFNFLVRHLHQIQGNLAGRNFVTAPRVNSRLIKNAEMNLKSSQRIQLSIINSLWNLGGYAWPGLTVSYGNNPNCAIKIAVTISKTTKAALFTFVQVASEIAATFNIIAILCAVGDARCTLGNHERTRPRIWSPYPTIRLRLYTAKFVVRASIEK